MNFLFSCLTDRLYRLLCYILSSILDKLWTLDLILMLASFPPICFLYLRIPMINDFVCKYDLPKRVRSGRNFIPYQCRIFSRSFRVDDENVSSWSDIETRGFFYNFVSEKFQNDAIERRTDKEDRGEEKKRLRDLMFLYWLLLGFSKEKMHKHDLSGLVTKIQVDILKKVLTFHLAGVWKKVSRFKIGSVNMS